jgi:hypothetical protein
VIFAGEADWGGRPLTARPPIAFERPYILEKLMDKTKKRVSRLIPIIVAASVAFVEPAYADDFPAGQACPFGIDITVSDGHALNAREFVDEDGNPVRLLITGNSPGLLITNTSSGESYSLKSRGQRQDLALHADGSMVITATGHTLAVYFPTDGPGPAVIAYIGQLVIDVDADGVWTIVRQSGKQVDVCALLE